jgi:hypothetical protein
VWLLAFSRAVRLRARLCENELLDMIGERKRWTPYAEIRYRKEIARLEWYFSILLGVIVVSWFMVLHPIGGANG